MLLSPYSTNIVRVYKEILLVVRNAVILTLAISLMLGLCALLHIPGWLQGFGFIPIAYLYFTLSREKPLPFWKLFGFVTMLCCFDFLSQEFLPRENMIYRILVFGLFLWFTQSASRWFDQRLQKRTLANSARSERMADHRLPL